MGRLALRVLMFVVGVSLLVVYLGLAYVGYLVVVALWISRPDPATVVLFLVTFTLAFGYLSYRFGTNRAIAGLDARELPPNRAPDVYARLDRLCEAMDLEHPRLLVGGMAAPNALALGGGEPVIVVDRSLFRLLDADEFETILAHELAHLESRDALVQTLAYSALRTLAGLLVLLLAPFLLVTTGLARAIAWMSGRPLQWHRTAFGRAQVLAGQLVAIVLLAFTLLVRAHSRRREFAADDRAVEVTGNPLALARALRRIERASRSERGLLSTLYVQGDEEGPLARMLSTHPDMDDRIERLVERAEGSARRIEIG